MKLSEIQATLTQLGTQPTKSLGQNFLHDANVAQWIVEQLEIKAGEHLVEVGPGLGALTSHAVPRADHATLIEKDGRLAGFLKERYVGQENVEIIHQDALDFDPRELFPRGPTKVLGNLPYYVTTPLLFQFTAEPSPVSRLVLTMQKEVAARLAAQPGTKDYGALTLLIGRRWKTHYLKTLPPTVFMPAPQVDSAVVMLEPRAVTEFPPCHGAKFIRLVKQGFSQRRKQLKNMLRIIGIDFEPIAQAMQIPFTARAEELDLAQWITITNLVDPLPLTDPSTAQDVHGEIFDVVNERDEVTGQMSRHEVHRQKLRHRAVHIFVFNAEGELFLQKRSAWKDKNPGAWDSSAAGHLNAGEGYDETAAREIQEELGVSAPVEFIARLEASEHTGYEFVHLYRATHEGPFVLPPSEIETGGFFPLPLLRRWVQARPQDFARSFIECLAHFPA